MKNLSVMFVLVLGGCGTVPWMQRPAVNEAACTASCDAHFEQCPQIFAGFPERGAVECPAEHHNCLRACATPHPAAPLVATPPVTATPPVQAMPGTVGAVPSKETRLRELKHLYEEGLVTDDVYKDRQKAILAEP